MRKLFIFSFFLLVLLTLSFGEAPWQEVWEGAVKKILGQSKKWNPLLDERLPRLIILLCTGASLTVAGQVLQSLFQNPLASPSILGISCGGSLAIIVTFIFSWHLTYPYALPIAAFSGALSTLGLVYFLSFSRGEVYPTTLILSGIAISSLLLAIQSAVLYAVRDRWDLIQTISEWELGSTRHLTWKEVHLQLPPSLIALFGCWHYHKEIDLLALGDEEAKNLGVEVSKVRFRLFLCVALLTAGSLAAVGVISFFGLVLPNFLRRVAEPISKSLIPLSIVCGSLLFSWLDLILRLLDIRALSIGSIAAILGGLFFVSLLYDTHRTVY